MSSAFNWKYYRAESTYSCLIGKLRHMMAIHSTRCFYPPKDVTIAWHGQIFFPFHSNKSNIYLPLC